MLVSPGRWLARDNPETTCITIKLETVSPMAEQSSWVPLTLLLSALAPLTNNISSFVSSFVSLDNSLPSVRQKLTLQPWKGFPFLQQMHDSFGQYSQQEQDLTSCLGPLGIFIKSYCSLLLPLHKYHWWPVYPALYSKQIQSLPLWSSHSRVDLSLENPSFVGLQSATKASLFLV